MRLFKTQYKMAILVMAFLLSSCADAIHPTRGWFEPDPILWEKIGWLVTCLVVLWIFAKVVNYFVDGKWD